MLPIAGQTAGVWTNWTEIVCGHSGVGIIG